MRVVAIRLVAIVGFALGAGNPAAAHNGRWEPPQIHPAAVSLDAILARIRTAAGTPLPAYDARIEHWSLRAGGATLPVIVTVRGADLRFDTVIDGATYTQGRNAGNRWRRTPNGLVRLIGADVQGDDLDRWPLASFPFDAADCAALGEASVGRTAAWVVEYRPAHDSPHWFYVDESSGRIVREVFREGSRNVTFDFTDVRTVDGANRPFAWHVSGAGGDADVAIERIDPQSVQPAAVAIPASLAPVTVFDANPVAVPAVFEGDRIRVNAIVNGRPGTFLFDTGTTQILLDEEAARRFGLQPVLGHAVVHEFRTGAITFHDVAVQTVPLAGFRADGILGYDYFLGHVVHVDFVRQKLQLIASETFVPPPDAYQIAANFDEAMPVVAARIGNASSSRVVLDTGSWNALVLRDFYDSDPAVLRRMGIGVVGRTHPEPFLEGTIDAASATVATIEFAGTRFVNDDIEVQVREGRDDVDFPIDAIFGTQLLDKFEWWFDYDDGRIWLRRN